MKPYKFSFSTHLFCVIACFVFGFPVSGQVYSYEQIDKATTRNASDTILAIEFKAAEYFHVFINDYRKSKGKNALEWSNVFWLTSRNHNMWMAENGFLTHTQTKKSTYFSGESPGDRLKQVVKDACGWSGENCLYNYSYSKNKSVDEAAYEIALYSINQWKQSNGHNENMLGGHSSQGTSFVVDKDGRVWGTTLFGGCYSESEDLSGHTHFRFSVSGSAPVYVPPQVTAKKKPASNEDPINKSPSKKYSSTKTRQIVEANIKVAMAGQGIKNRNYFNKAASKHSIYMYHTQNESVLQEKKSAYFYGIDTRKRLLKASNGRSMFLANKKGIQEFIFYQEYSTYSFGIDEVEDDVQYWLKTIDLMGFKFGGVGIKVGKRKEVVKVAISLILHPK